MRREKAANKFPFSPGFHYLCHMIRKANCKINIGLDVLCRREDGYHELATVMIPVYGLYDVVEVEHAAQTSFRSSGLTVDCSDADNLCMKAVRLMQARYGAGDVSVALDELFGLELPERELIDCAAALGSDTAFFVRNTPQFCTGRGEVMSPVELDLRGLWIAVVKPDCGVSTREAYAGIRPGVPAVPLA